MVLAVNSFSQVQEHAKWKYEVEKITNNKLQLVLTATIVKGWHIYSSDMEDGGPQKTELTLQPGKNFTALGKLSAHGAFI